MNSAQIRDISIAIDEYSPEVERIANSGNMHIEDSVTSRTLEATYPNFRKLWVCFRSYLKNTKGLESCPREQLLPCFDKSLKLNIPIDGENAYIIPYNRVPRLILGYKGLINIVTSHIGGNALIRVRAFTENACKLLTKEPAYDESLPLEYYDLQEIPTIDNIKIVIVYLITDGECKYHEIYSKQELLTRISHEQRNSPIWGSRQRSTDGAEMLKKTAIRHFCKTFPNMPSYIQEL